MTSKLSSVPVSFEEVETSLIVEIYFHHSQLRVRGRWVSKQGKLGMEGQYFIILYQGMTTTTFLRTKKGGGAWGCRGQHLGFSPKKLFCPSLRAKTVMNDTSL